MSFKKTYHYLFYKFYRFYERGPSIWLSDWKAAFSLMVLEIWLLPIVSQLHQILLRLQLQERYLQKKAIPLKSIPKISWLISMH